MPAASLPTGCLRPLRALACCAGPILCTPGVAAQPPEPEVAARAFFVQQGLAQDARSTAVGLLWDLGWRRTLGGGTLSAYLDLLAGYWRTKPGGEAPRSGVKQFGVTPALRYHFAGAPGAFVEAGIGLNILTPKYQSGERRFSSVANFGDRLGVGWRSARSGWEVALRFEHFSNAGFDHPNPGENFVQLRVALDLD